MRHSNRGASAFLVVVALLAIIGGILAFLAFMRSFTSASSSTQTVASLAIAQNALEQFASISGRLPCPADPAANTGDAVPAGASAACTFPAGTIPWKTIGSRYQDSLDSWGWKISYRVYTGAAGSLTQASGISMVDCDTDELVPAGTAAGGVCRATRDTTDVQFLAGKGLSLNDFGTVRNDVAYVLVSHGPTGLGAFTNAGVPKDPPGNAAELANLMAAGPFVAQAAAGVGMLATNDPAYFDDVLAYRSVAELVAKANLAARDWPEPLPPPPGLIQYTMDAATVSAAMGGGPVSPGSLGDDRIDFGSGADRARVRGSDSGGNQDISFDTSGGASGLGITGNGSNLMTSTNSERLRIDFGQSGSKFGVALAHFGTYDVSGTTHIEQVEFRFRGGTTDVDIVKSGCRADGGVATFSIDPGTDFDRVDIRPRAAIPSGVTAIALADFKLCDASPASCISDLATTGNVCP